MKSACNRKAFVKSLLACLAVTIFTDMSQARPVRWWNPEELAERSDFIIVGQPIEIKPTGKDGSIKLGTNPDVPIKFYSAKVRVIARIKGSLPKEIQVEFTQVDFEKLGGAVINGPGRFALTTDHIYVLYLNKKDEEGAYVGALFGEFDDNQAAVTVAPAEKDSNK